MAVLTRLSKTAPDAALVGTYLTTAYSTEETALRAAAPILFLDPARRYLENALATDVEANFRYHAAMGLETFRPFGLARPRLVSWTSRTVLRFAFGEGLSLNNTAGLTGALIQESATAWMPATGSYTLGYIVRIPIPSTEGCGTNTGGTFIGGRAASSNFISSVQSGTGFIDHRHDGTAGPSNTTDRRTGVPMSIVYFRDGPNNTITCRINGAAVTNWTTASYSADFASTGARQWMIGGGGATAVAGAVAMELGPKVLFDRYLLGAGETAALAALNAYLVAELAKY